MNDYLVMSILYYLYRRIHSPNKNDLLNIIEEYIEWCNYSKTRFTSNKDYPAYLDKVLHTFKEVQGMILLDEIDKAEVYLMESIVNDYFTNKL